MKLYMYAMLAYWNFSPFLDVESIYHVRKPMTKRHHPGTMINC